MSNRNADILAARNHFADYVRGNGADPDIAFTALSMLLAGKGDAAIADRLSWQVKSTVTIQQLIWLCRQFIGQHPAQARLACRDMQPTRGFAAKGRTL